MENADHIIDIGPEAGSNGGEIIAQGTYEEIKKIKIVLLDNIYQGKNLSIEIPKKED